MQTIEQEPRKPRHSAIIIVAAIFALAALICFVISLTIFVLNNFNLLKLPSPNFLTTIFNTLGTLLGIFSAASAAWQRFFQWVLSRIHLETNRPSAPPTAYSSISSLPPPTDSTAILQRENAVKLIYDTLIQPEFTAIVLTGIVGIGKSTLAALVYRYVENQRHQHWGVRNKNRSFAAETLWLEVDPSKKIIDIAGTLFKYLGKSMPSNFENLPPQVQALTLTTLLKAAKKPRLIVLDQFDTLFDIHTGDALRDHPGIGDWLDTLNSERCNCKILFTSCSWLQGTQIHPRTHMQEYHVEGVNITEGIELLRKHGIEASEAEVSTIIELCNGHIFALIELINFLQRHQVTLTTFLKNDSYFQLWRKNIALHLLRNLYTRQLDALERKLLSAFAVYRTPIPLEAAEAVLGSNSTRTEILKALDVLLTQHLLRPSGGGDYKLHPLVAHYIQYDLEESDEQSSYRPSRETHIKAAECCWRQVIQTRLLQGGQRNVRDLCWLVEGVRQWCQSEQWQKAFELMRSENIPADLRSWGENAILLDLYKLLLPLDKWHPQDAQKADIYSKLGEAHAELINKHSDYADEALRYYKLSYILYDKMKDHAGVILIMRYIGMFYFKKEQYNNALAFFLQAEKLSRETQSPSEEESNKCKEELLRHIGEERYNVLLQEVIPQAEQIVEGILY